MSAVVIAAADFFINKVVMTPERRQRITHALNRRQPDLTVVMENVFDPHNIAAVMVRVLLCVKA